jgi:hypothetical protein
MQPDLIAVPRVVIAHLAKQLDIAEPSCLLHYRGRAVASHEHAPEIQRRHGYRDFHEQPQLESVGRSVLASTAVLSMMTWG